MADESHADILAEMRRCVESNGTNRRKNVHMTVRTWLGLIERLEKANQREAKKKSLGFLENGVHYTDKEMKDMKLILIDGKRKFEVLPAKSCDKGECDYAKHDVKSDKTLFCEKKCYIPQKYMKFLCRAYNEGFALSEICQGGKETNGDA